MAHADTFRKKNHRKMKHVIVYYVHNGSADYLKDENLPNDPLGMAPNYDSTSVLEERQENTLRKYAGRRADICEALQTGDGIQYWHFKHKDIVPGQSEETAEQDARDIRYWIKKLDEKLQTEGGGETIDAIVLPLSLEQGESSLLVEFINTLKERYPDIKVIVHDSIVKVHGKEGDKTNRFVWADNEKGIIRNGNFKVTIRRQEDGSVIGDNGQVYHLQRGVDMVTQNFSGSDKGQQNVLRELLGMEPLQQQSRGYW